MCVGVGFVFVAMCAVSLVRGCVGLSVMECIVEGDVLCVAGLVCGGSISRVCGRAIVMFFGAECL